MFRLIKWGFVLMCLAGLTWFSWSVKLGDRTLVEHVRAIGASDESRNLVRGTKQKADEVREQVGHVKDVVGKTVFGSGNTLAKQEAPAEDHRPEDQQALKSLIGSAQKK